MLVKFAGCAHHGDRTIRPATAPTVNCGPARLAPAPERLGGPAGAGQRLQPWGQDCPARPLSHPTIAKESWQSFHLPQHAWVRQLGNVSKIICVRFVENYTKGRSSAVPQVLVRVFEKMLKVLQMFQFIQKLREKKFPFLDPPWLLWNFSQKVHRKFLKPFLRLSPIHTDRAYNRVHCTYMTSVYSRLQEKF